MAIPDMQTLAGIHAALDSVVEIEQLLAAIKAGSEPKASAVTRLVDGLANARETLRHLLTRPDLRQLSEV